MFTRSLASPLPLSSLAPSTLARSLLPPRPPPPPRHLHARLLSPSPGSTLAPEFSLARSLHARSLVGFPAPSLRARFLAPPSQPPSPSSLLRSLACSMLARSLASCSLSPCSLPRSLLARSLCACLFAACSLPPRSLLCFLPPSMLVSSLARIHARSSTPRCSLACSLDARSFAGFPSPTHFILP